jgi:hypothetical protein
VGTADFNLDRISGLLVVHYKRPNASYSNPSLYQARNEFNCVVAEKKF